MKYSIKYTLVGGNLSNINTLKTEIQKFVSLMNGQFENDWVLTGSAALKIIYYKYLETYPSAEITGFDVNDLDFLVYKSKNEAIGRHPYFGYQPDDETLLRSKKFINPDEEFVKEFDLTYTALPIFKIVIDGIPIIHPQSLLGFYNQDNENNKKEIGPKLDIISNTQLLEFYENNYPKTRIPLIESKQDKQDDGSSKRLFSDESDDESEGSPHNVKRKLF